MSITKRMDLLEKQVKQLTDMLIKSDKVMNTVLAQTNRLLKELAASKSFEKVEHES